MRKSLLILSFLVFTMLLVPSLTYAETIDGMVNVDKERLFIGILGMKTIPESDVESSIIRMCILMGAFHGSPYEEKVSIDEVECGHLFLSLGQ